MRSRAERPSVSEVTGQLHFFSPMPLLLAYGTMGIEMAIAPLWVERRMGDDGVIKSEKYELYAKVKRIHMSCCIHPIGIDKNSICNMKLRNVSASSRKQMYCIHRNIEIDHQRHKCSEVKSE